MSLKGLTVAFLALAAVLVASPQVKAASAPDIDAGVDATLDTFFYQVRGARELAHKAVGILVFPSIVKAGFGFGGECGEGALRRFRAYRGERFRSRHVTALGT